VATGLKEQRRERRVREILEAAMAVFEEKGYPRATMEEIAERALLSRVALYRYFKDKEAILKALIRWKTAELTERFEAVPAGGYAESVRRLAREGLSFRQANQGFFRVLYTATGLPGLLQDPEFRAQKQALVGSVARVIEAGQAAGEARPGDAVLFAEFFLSLIFSAIARDFFDERAEIPSPETVAEVFLSGTLAV